MRGSANRSQWVRASHVGAVCLGAWDRLCAERHQSLVWRMVRTGREVVRRDRDRLSRWAAVGLWGGYGVWLLGWGTAEPLYRIAVRGVLVFVIWRLVWRWWHVREGR